MTAQPNTPPPRGRPGRPRRIHESLSAPARTIVEELNALIDTHHAASRPRFLDSVKDSTVKSRRWTTQDLSRQLGDKRYTKGPDWTLVEFIVNGCLDKPAATAHLRELAALYRAARDQPAPGFEDVLAEPTLQVGDSAPAPSELPKLATAEPEYEALRRRISELETEVALLQNEPVAAAGQSHVLAEENNRAIADSRQRLSQLADPLTTKAAHATPTSIHDLLAIDPARDAEFALLIQNYNATARDGAEPATPSTGDNPGDNFGNDRDDGENEASPTATPAAARPLRRPHYRASRRRHVGRHRAPMAPRTRYAMVVTSAVVGAGVVAFGAGSALPQQPYLAGQTARAGIHDGATLTIGPAETRTARLVVDDTAEPAGPTVWRLQGSPTQITASCANAAIRWTVRADNKELASGTLRPEQVSSGGVFGRGLDIPGGTDVVTASFERTDPLKPKNLCTATVDLIGLRIDRQPPTTRSQIRAGVPEPVLLSSG